MEKCILNLAQACTCNKLKINLFVFRTVNFGNSLRHAIFNQENKKSPLAHNNFFADKIAGNSKLNKNMDDVS